jgi:hypothetical protein
MDFWKKLLAADFLREFYRPIYNFFPGFLYLTGYYFDFVEIIPEILGNFH